MKLIPCICPAYVDLRFGELDTETFIFDYRNRPYGLEFNNAIFRANFIYPWKEYLSSKHPRLVLHTVE